MTNEEFKALSNWEKVRTLTGIMELSGNDKQDLNRMIGRMGLVCLISRVEMGDADPEFLDDCIDSAFGIKKEKQDDRQTDGQTESTSDSESNGGEPGAVS